MFDITQLETTDTAKFHVVNAKGAPQYDGETPITITAYGPGTKRAAEAKHRRDKANTKRVLAGVGGKEEERSEAEERTERAAFLAAVTASLDGFTVDGGAEALFKNPKLRYLADAFEKWWNDSGNFSGDSATTSPSA